MIRQSCINYFTMRKFFIGICKYVIAKTGCVGLTPAGLFAICFNPKVFSNSKYFFDFEEILFLPFIVFLFSSLNVTPFSYTLLISPSIW